MHVYIYSIYTYGHSPHDLPPTSSMFPSILVTPDGRHRGTQENQNCGKKWKYITIFWDSLQRSPRRKPQQPWKNKKQDSRKGKNYIQYFETPGWTPHPQDLWSTVFFGSFGFSLVSWVFCFVSMRLSPRPLDFAFFFSMKAFLIKSQNTISFMCFPLLFGLLVPIKKKRLCNQHICTKHNNIEIANVYILMAFTMFWTGHSLLFSMYSNVVPAPPQSSIQ